MQIKIIKGTYGHRPTGSSRIRPVSAGDVVTVSEAEAERLIRIGVASPVSDAPQTAFEEVATLYEGQFDGEVCVGMDTEALVTEDGEDMEEASHLAPEQLKSMTNAALRELAQDMGISTAKCKNKTDLVEAILAVDTALNAGDAEPAPVFHAADPVT